jgi:formylglycine-generating enzyme
MTTPLSELARRLLWRPEAAALVLLAACEPGAAPARPQWEIFVATDAPVPALGDRLIVEILTAEGELGCADCRRQFGAASPAVWPVSFGVVQPEAGGEIWVRALLYRTDHAGADGYPSGEAHLQALGRLPSAPGVVQVALLLQTDCFGVPAVPTEHLGCDAGKVVPATDLPIVADPAELPAVGSWPGAAETPCPTPPQDGMVCVPGGAFVMGHIDSFNGLSSPERLVIISPFALDRHELTVGEIKALYAGGGLDRLPRMKNPATNSADHACTFAAGDENDALPVNCIDHALAKAACAQLGKRLPTEAEWEWAAGNRSRETPYPWGFDSDVCAHAVVGRGRNPLEFSMSGESARCRVQGETLLPWGPVAGGRPEDVSDLGIRDLAGNVSEWVADAFAPYDDGSCWPRSGEGIVRDPVCSAPSGAMSTRGGAWSQYVFQAIVTSRNWAAPSSEYVALGVRCAASL